MNLEGLITSYGEQKNFTEFLLIRQAFPDFTSDVMNLIRLCEKQIRDLFDSAIYFLKGYYMFQSPPLSLACRR